MLNGYSHTLDEELAAERVRIPAAVRGGGFAAPPAIGAVVDCSRSDLIRISCPARASGMIAYDRKIPRWRKVTLNP
ncbi:MAG: hypothetical protein ACLUFT_11025 [Gemmiger formicilis]|uniref:hypothetical protein n=1 Tax=Gemmiger formicilis TaxID=745368 RepID=UPI003991E41F